MEAKTFPLGNLPAEIIYHILSYLPIPSLLAFSTTCKLNHAYHTRSLSALSLAVFPKQVQALIAFLQSSSDLPSPARRQVPVILHKTRHKGRIDKPKPIQYQKSVVSDQNQVLTTIARRYGQALQDLEFFAWELTEEAATALATSCSSLKRLALCFDHPHGRDPCMPALYFDKPGAPSTLWNALAGIGSESSTRLAIRGLHSLRLERTAITEYQLRKFLEANPGLSELRLRKCAGADFDFCTWLGSSKLGTRLELLWIDDCDNVRAQDKGHLQWICGVPNLKVGGF